MNNYQLYRTNVLLGGQMKWDLVLDATNTSLCISNFNLTPISSNVPRSYSNDKYLLTNTHQENVKTYYDKYKSVFFNEMLSHEFTNLYPTISNPGEVKDSYSNTYDRGCKRMEYKKYNKQFEFLCPLWLEHLTEPLRFDFIIKSPGSDYILSQKSITFEPCGATYHDAFVNYFNQYIIDSGIANGNEELIKIEFGEIGNTPTGIISGLDVVSGVFMTKNADSIVADICRNERLLLDFDETITKMYASSNMVCRQLFNFNLCFNLDDLLLGNMLNTIMGKEVQIVIDVYAGDTLLSKTDFYTDYTFIDRDVLVIDGNHNFKANVLDCLKDNESVDLMGKNKFAQSICHWSLREDPTYIFNLYEGFSGLILEEKESNEEGSSYNIYENEKQYGQCPNIDISVYDITQNPTGWCTNIRVNSWGDFYKYILHTEKYKTNATKYSKRAIVNGLKYKTVPEAIANKYVMTVYTTTDEVLATITNNVKCYNVYNNTVYAVLKDDLLILISNNIDCLTFKKMSNILYKVTNNIDDFVSDVMEHTGKEELIHTLLALYNMMATVINPSIVTFKHILSPIPALPSNIPHTEVKYEKYNNVINHYVVRYDGNIKPCFTNKINTLYYKDYITSELLPTSNYTKYATRLAGYLCKPTFPSLGYCTVKPIENCNYATCPKVQVSAFTEPVSIYTTNHEYSWFDDNRCLVLVPEIHIDHIAQPENEATFSWLNSVIKAHLIERYKLTNDCCSLVDYILSKYDIKYDWDYASVDSISNYIYKITLTLK